MQYLVITKDNGEVNWSNHSELLRSEAEHVLSLFCKGVVRNIWFTEKKDAVLILECDCIEDVGFIMSKLPLVSHDLITYDITCLLPYTGFERIMDGTD
ncbi:MAG: hypothetical protein A3J97_11575 [Spirochaetes bacterium RIFOXYC1_FULL_54_7]|nr:MAG: hypothetical protein A3J97_11575 [Spirochaetes bacterium RIFOXYC1_FULL_54_7]